MKRLVIANMMVLMGASASALDLDCTVKNHITVDEHEAYHTTNHPQVGSKFKLVVSGDGVSGETEKLYSAFGNWKFDDDAEFGYLSNEFWSLSPDDLSRVAYEIGDLYFTQTTGVGVTIISAKCEPK